MIYEVLFIPDPILKQKNTSYGYFEAKSKFDAIEKIISQDEIRNIIPKSSPELRHYGMVAVKASTEQLLEEIQKIAKEVQDMDKSFSMIEQLYEKDQEEIIRLKQSAAFGATFHYHNTDDRFIPVFALPENLEINYEKPHSFTLNFDQKILAQWLVECEISLEKEKK